MTEPNLDEQIQLILRDFDNAVSIYTIEVKARYETAKAQIQEIIANQVREARKDELAKLIFNDDEFATLEEIKNGKSVGGGMIQTELVEDRIKELGE